MTHVNFILLSAVETCQQAFFKKISSIGHIISEFFVCSCACNITSMYTIFNTVNLNNIYSGSQMCSYAYDFHIKIELYPLIKINIPEWLFNY